MAYYPDPNDPNAAAWAASQQGYYDYSQQPAAGYDAYAAYGYDQSAGYGSYSYPLSQQQYPYPSSFPAYPTGYDPPSASTTIDYGGGGPSNNASTTASKTGSKLPIPSGPVGVGPGVGVPKKGKKKTVIRAAGGQVWEDSTLADWDDNDFRIFVGDLGNEVSDEMLAKAFSKYPSFQRARVVRDKRTEKTKGYGFASFKDPNDYVAASREMNGKYVGTRPIKIRKSTWKDRNVDVKSLKKTHFGGIVKK